MIRALSCLLDGVGRARNCLYDRGYLASEKLPTCVVSVGNLSLGGTGKTPVTAFLTQLLTAHGLRVVILSRGYGGNYSGVVTRVPVQGVAHELAPQYGDEPTWLARTFPQVPVFVGRDRVRAGRDILQTQTMDVLLLDDAFQHRRLQRDFDFVLVDATEPIGALRVVPAGRAREGAYALGRASGVILNKVNLAEGPRARQWREWIQAHTHAPVWDFDYQCSTLHEPMTHRHHSPGDLRAKKVFLISAVAKPELFARTVRQFGDVEIMGHHQFSDHHLFTEADIAECRRQSQGCDWIVISQKDETKFKASWMDKVLVTQLTVACSTQTQEQIYEMVRTKIH